MGEIMERKEMRGEEGMTLHGNLLRNGRDEKKTRKERNEEGKHSVGVDVDWKECSSEVVGALVVVCKLGNK
jgi:hypothetical protein